jgi:hypothetical protein
LGWECLVKATGWRRPTAQEDVMHVKDSVCDGNVIKFYIVVSRDILGHILGIAAPSIAGEEHTIIYTKDGYLIEVDTVDGKLIVECPKRLRSLLGIAVAPASNN